MAAELSYPHQDGPPEEWSEKKPGVWSRPFSLCDHFFVAITSSGEPIGQQQWRLIPSVKFKLEAKWTQQELIAKLRDTWRTMRYYYPVSGISIDKEKAQMVYKVASDQDIEDWLDKTFQVRSDITSTDLTHEISNPPYPILYYLPHESELVYAASHIFTDGLGLVNFFALFFRFLDHPEHPKFGNEQKYLTPSTEALSGVSTEMSPEKLEKARILMQQDREAAEKTIAFPRDKIYDTPGRTDRRRITFDEATTSKIIAQSKKNGWSVTSSLYAAAIDALFKQPDMVNAENNIYGSHAPINLRNHIDRSIVNTYPLANVLDGVMVHAQRGPFKEMAAQVSSIFKKGLMYPGYDVSTIYDAHIAELGPFMAPKPPPEGVDPNTWRAPPPPGCNAPYLSSFGFIDKMLPSQYESVSLEDFRMGGRVANAAHPMHFWTFKGKFNVNLTFNEAFVSAKQIERYLESVRECLLEGLEIES